MKNLQIHNNLDELQSHYAERSGKKSACCIISITQNSRKGKPMWSGRKNNRCGKGEGKKGYEGVSTGADKVTFWGDGHTFTIFTAVMVLQVDTHQNSSNCTL